MASCEHKMVKAQMNAQLFGCSWVGATFISINNTLIGGIEGGFVEKGFRDQGYMVL